MFSLVSCIEMNHSHFLSSKHSLSRTAAVAGMSLVNQLYHSLREFRHRTETTFLKVNSPQTYEQDQAHFVRSYAQQIVVQAPKEVKSLIGRLVEKRLLTFRTSTQR